MKGKTVRLHLSLSATEEQIYSVLPTSRSLRKLGRITLIVDSGATVPITGLKRLFRVLVKLRVPIVIVLGKGTATATHIGIVELNFPAPGDKKFYSLAQIFLYCCDFKDLNIISVSRLAHHHITYVQNDHNDYLLNTNGLTSNYIPNKLTSKDHRAYRIIDCRRQGGLTVTDHVRTDDLPSGSTRIDFMSGQPYKFDDTIVLRLHKLADHSPSINYTLQEGAHLAVCTVLLQSTLPGELIPYGDFYHGRAVMNEIDRDLGLESVGGYDNAPDALRIYRQRNPNALSLEDCKDPRVTTVLERSALAVYTPPCQAYSIGGRMRGSADPEGRHLVECLLPQMHMPPNARPVATLLEMVTGVLRMAEFQVVRQQLRNCDNTVTEHIIDSLDVGSSSKRERVFLLGIDRDHALRFPKAYARMLHELAEMPEMTPRAVIEFVDHPLDRDQHQLREPSHYHRSDRVYSKHHRGPMKVAHYHTLKIEDDLFSAYGPATVVRASYPSWYLINIRDWNQLHGHPVHDDDDRYVAIQLKPREAARAMDIDDDSPIGDDGDEHAAHKLVGNGIPVRLIRHVVTPVVWFLRVARSGIDISAGGSQRRVRFSQVPSPPLRTFGQKRVTMLQVVDVSELLRDETINDDITAASTENTGNIEASDTAASTQTRAIATADSEETSYMPYRLDYKYIQRNRDSRGWPAMMSPSDPRFARKVYEVNYNHSCDHNSRSKTEQEIEMGTKFKYTMYPGDTRYMSECTTCIQAKAARNRMRSRSATHGANREVPLPGTHATMDTIDLGGARAGGVVTFFGSHRYSVNFCDLASDRTVVYPVQNLHHTSILEAVKWYLHLCASTTRRKFRVFYTDLAPAHYEQGKMAEHRTTEKYEFQAVAAGEHDKRSRIERKNYELMRRTRANLMALIGHTIKGRLITKANVKEFWNLALHRAAVDLWHAPSDYLLQESQTYRCADMAFFETNTPPDRSSIRPFGESCFHYPKLPSERHNLDNPWLKCIYLFPAAFSPFNYKMVHIRPGVTIIDHKSTLQVTGQMKFNDGTSWQVRMSEDLAANASASQLPVSSSYRWDSDSQRWMPETPTPANALPPPRAIEPPAAATTPTPMPDPVVDTEPEPVEHDPDNISWDNLMQHSPPYRIALGPKGQRGKSGMSMHRFALYRNATNVAEYQRLHPKLAFDLVDGRPAWRTRRPGENVVSWKAEFRNDIQKGIFRFVRPDLQAKINARYPEARAEFGNAVDAELQESSSGGG